MYFPHQRLTYVLILIHSTAGNLGSGFGTSFLFENEKLHLTINAPGDVSQHLPFYLRQSISSFAGFF